MYAQDYVRLLQRLHYTAKIVVPVLLSLDMCHNVYLVQRLWKARLREWQHQDDCRTIANISHICQQMVRKCQLQHAELWPAGLLCVAASARTPDQEAEKEPAGTEALHAEEDFFASCGIPLREEDSMLQQQTAKGPATALRHTEGMQAPLPAAAGPGMAHVVDLAQWQLLDAVRAAWQQRWQGLRPAVDWQCRWVQLLQRLHGKLECALQQHAQALPLPHLSCTRLSALRFQIDHVEWEAVAAALYPHSKPAPLELVLDEQY